MQPNLDARVVRLERDAVFADVLRAQLRREWTVTLIIVQIGIAVIGAIYAGVHFSWISQDLIAPNGPLFGYAALLLAIATVGHALSGIRELIRMRRVERSLYQVDPAE